MGGGSGMHQRIAPPIDKRPQQAALAEMFKATAHPSRIERAELSVRHLAARHGEFSMVALGDMASDQHIVRLIGQHQARQLVPAKGLVNLRIGGVATGESVTTIE